LGNLSTSPLFQQVFGVFVNVSGGLFGTTQPTSLNIPKAVLTNLFQANVTDWSQASNTLGNALASGSETVHIVNREAGSGSRAGASIYFTGYECSASASDIADPAGATGDFFSTGNVLAAANTTVGGITYASIDNFSTTTYPNLALVAIDGIVPSNLNAAAGQYDYWFESTAIPASGLSTSSAALSSWLIGELQDINTEPHLIDVNAIPGNSSNDTPALPVSGTANTLPTGGQAIYVNQFTRAGSSCNTPLDAL
jgi:ABC-type phosphate transport system substrate-binding protein